MLETSRYAALRRGGKLLARLAFWEQLGMLLLGFGLFLDQAQGLLSDAQFTWGERRVMGLIALVTLGGCGLAGWILGQLLRVAAEVLDVMADGAEAAWRAGDLLEQHVVPTLGRIALALERREGKADDALHPTPGVGSRIEALRAELDQAKSAGRIARVFDLRDALTQHLRGQSLHALDGEVAGWLQSLVERHVRHGTVDAEVAVGVARAIDSLGDMPETELLRTALPGLRRRAGLCYKCGRPASGQDATCIDCWQGGPATGTAGSPSRPRSSKERS
jgi:hypothetical protein